MREQATSRVLELIHSAVWRLLGGGEQLQQQHAEGVHVKTRGLDEGHSRDVTQGQLLAAGIDVWGAGAEGVFQ